MSQPETLLEISGVKPQPVDWTKSVLILIDYQHEYVDGKLDLGEPGVESVLIAKKLLEKARKEGAPVFHVVHHGKAGGAAFNPETQNVNIISDLTPDKSEPVIIKSLPNAFAKTDLVGKIHETGRTQLIFCGFMSHMCVASSVRSAIDHGFNNVVCSDACATRDLSDELGNVIPADLLHSATMASLRDRFANVCSSDFLLK